ncbi:helix-turn-helix domain-containing protein (plasmid) [Escherichia fergusonii]|nr:helix-turn-helix domain-containing protein [Escherichia fergusonii]UAT42387.1 helix-turn-helix domain-containing protein [Escherichia fergusonii]HCJ5930727.1 helix-turn-helix domain-containing protein [Escherichia coli]HCJ9146106.1 helix-turn-helix domain-containing protein [Escherichia coli]
MLHTTNPVIKHKAGLLNLAEELSNVSKACKIMGVSRDTFYRYRELADEGGVDALINRSRRVLNLKNRTDDATEQAVIDYAIAFPAHGQHRTSNELRKQGVFISGSGVRSIWLRHNLENFKKRLKALEEKVARDGIELTDSQSAALERKACDDEACVESFFHSLKVECIHGERFVSRGIMWNCIECDYNHWRRHSACGDLSPE